MSRAWKLSTSEVFAALVAVTCLPTAQAFCSIDAFGFEHCSLGTGIRAGIAIAILALGLLLVGIVLAVRRRRTQRANLSHINRPPVEQNPNQYPYQRNAQWQGGNVQYPPQTYAYPPYDPTTGFAPPQGAPPAYYPSSQGPPPGKEAL